MWCVYTHTHTHTHTHPHTMEYYSAIKKNKIIPLAATWMQLDLSLLSELSQKEKDKYHMISHIWNVKYGKNEPICFINRNRLIENRLVITKGEG